MKTAIVTEAYKVEIQEKELPALRDNDVKIRVEMAGICGSDLHLFKGTHAFRKPPAILGHEIAGEVVETGAGVTRFTAGDRVTVEPQVGCGKCEFCLDHRVNLCPNKTVPGTPSWSGTFAEYFIAPEQTLYPLADQVDYKSGVMVEPLAVAVQAMNVAGEAKGGTAAILGCGTIGLLALEIAKLYGYGRTYCTDTANFNLELARELGAEAAYNPLENDPVPMIREATGGRGVDVVFVAAGAPGIIDQASAMTRKGGKIVLIAMITTPIPVYTYSIVFNEQALLGSMTYTTEAFLKASELVNGGLPVGKVVTHVLPMSEAQRGLDMLDKKAENVGKILVQP